MGAAAGARRAASAAKLAASEGSSSMTRRGVFDREFALGAQDFGGPRQIDDDSRASGREMAEAERGHEIVAAALVLGRAANLRVEAKGHFRQIDDDLIWVGDGKHDRRHLGRRLEDEARPVLLLLDPHGDRRDRLGGLRPGPADDEGEAAGERHACEFAGAQIVGARIADKTANHEPAKARPASVACRPCRKSPRSRKSPANNMAWLARAREPEIFLRISG